MPNTLKRIPVGSYRATESEKVAIREVLDSGQLSPGPKVAQFEQAFAERHGCPVGVMTNSGTDALRIALAALKEAEGWKDGDVILCPSVTFVATVNVVLQLGLKPMLIDVDLYDYTLNPWNLERRLDCMPDTSRIKGLIVVHLAGQPANMPEIMRMASTYKLKVIEDSCETMGVEVGGKPVGSWGDVGCFSFYVAHLLTTGVGGMAITNNPDLAVLMRSFENHGRDPYYIPGYAMPELSVPLLQARYRYDRLGYSCRPTEFEAALGLCQLQKLDSIIHERQEIAKQLMAKLLPYPLVLPRLHPNNACMMYPLAIPETETTNKWDLCLHLEKHGIETRELLPLTNQPCYKGLWNIDEYSVAKQLNEKAFYIGCHQDMTEEDVAQVGEAFDSFFRRP